MRLFKKETGLEFNYDPKLYSAVLKCSICNGEQVAGFKDRKTGEFHEITLITSPAQLDAFLEKYKIEVITKEY